MKAIRLGTMALAVLALSLGVSAFPAAAAPGNTFPGAAAYIDNQTHAIAPNASLWYRFDYAGDRSTITITMPNATNTGVAFNVFTPSQIGDWWDEHPIGRGTPQAVNCGTGLPQNNGGCQAVDLTWIGDFNAGGTYYVEVVNDNVDMMNFQLMIQGSGVTLASPVAASSAGASQGTTPSTTTAKPAIPAPSGAPPKVPGVSGNIDPGHATVIDNQGHMIPANSSLWYRFNYAGDRSAITVTLANGTNSGLGFNVFTPAQVGDWWDEKPVGRGTAQTVNCDTGQPDESGGCQAYDLSWIGDFNASGTYYVQVVNNNANPMTAQLTIQGDGVTLGQ
jgi:hypothetical protein